MQMRMTEFGLHWVDGLVALVLLYGLIRGARRGFAGELARLIYMGLVLIGARTAHPYFTTLFSQHTRLDIETSDTVGLILGATLSVLLVLLLRLLIKKLFQFGFRGKLEQVGGALLGLLTTFLLISVIFLFAARAPWPEVSAIAMKDSMTGRVSNFLFPPLYMRLTEKYPLPLLPPVSNQETEIESPASQNE